MTISTRSKFLLLTISVVVIIAIAVYYITAVAYCQSTLSRPNQQPSISSYLSAKDHTNNKGIQFDFIDFNGLATVSPNRFNFNNNASYDGSMTNPDRANYRIAGFEYFTLLGDGKYTWDEDPYHEYKASGNYVISTHVSAIKNNGPPPPRLVDQDLNACPSNSSSITNVRNLIASGSGIACEYSRPFKCGKATGHPTPTSVVYIIKVKAKNSVTAKLSVSFPTTMIRHKVITYTGFNSAFKNIVNNANLITMDCQLSPGQEYAVFIEFELGCDCKAPIKSIPITATFSEPNLKDEICTNDIPVQKCGPFDPNWLESSNELCVSLTSVECTKYPLDAFFYFIGNGDRSVEVTVEAKDNFVSRLVKSGTNPAYKVDYNNDPSLKVLRFNSCIGPNTCKEFSGLGSNSSQNDELGYVNFEVVLNPFSGSSFLPQELEFELTSTFSGVSSYSSSLKLPLNFECQIDSSSFTIACPIDIPDITDPIDFE